jgi:hypothetical protein
MIYGNKIEKLSFGFNVGRTSVNSDSVIKNFHPNGNHKKNFRENNEKKNVFLA